MLDLKRTIAGVRLYADTTDPAAVEKLKRVLDAGMKALKNERLSPPQGEFARTLLEALKPFR